VLFEQRVNTQGFLQLLATHTWVERLLCLLACSVPGRRVGKGEAHQSATVDDKLKTPQGKDLRNQFQLRSFLPGRKRVVRFNDEANESLGEELEIAVSGAGGNELRAKSVIKAGAARGVQKWRFFDFPTEQIEQPQLMLVEILRIERNHQLAVLNRHHRGSSG